MRWRQRLMGLTAILILFVLGRHACIEIPRFGSAHHPRMSGLFHVHSARSHDSKLTDSVIAQHAKSLGHSFVILTDHNVQDPSPITLRDHVLLMSATELSTPLGHICAIGARSTLLEDPNRLTTPMESIHQAHGMAVIAHPSCPKRPYTGELDGADGVEIVNVASTARTLWRRPNELLELLLSLPRASRASVLMQTYRRDEAVLRAWDAPRATALGGFCAADAHGRFDLLSNFMAWHLIVDLPQTARPSGNAILKTLQGRTFVCVAGAFGRDPGLSLEAHLSERTKSSLMLRRDADGASSGALRLLRDGVEIKRTDGDALIMQNPEPGLWRGELLLWVPRVLGWPVLRTVAYTQQIRIPTEAES